MCQQQGRVYLGPLETNQMCIELIEHGLGSVILLGRKKETTLVSNSTLHGSYTRRSSSEERSSMWTQSGAVCFARHVQYGSSGVITWWEEFEEGDFVCVCVCPYVNGLLVTPPTNTVPLSPKDWCTHAISRSSCSTNQECICSNQAESSAYCSFQKGRWDTIFILPMPSI